MNTVQAVPPWYKQFWPWFLIFLPASAVVAGLTTLYIAETHHVDLVAGDYYKEGLAINVDLTREQAARQMGLKGDVVIDPRNGVMHVTLMTKHMLSLSAVGVQLLHPTIAHHDVHTVLRADPGGGFSGHVGVLPPGNWHVIIEPPDKRWRLHGRFRLPGSGHAVIDPG